MAALLNTRERRPSSPLSLPLAGIRHGGQTFSVVHFNLDALESRQSPILLLDDFRVSGRPFGPHPHAGFSAITYVFEDSEGSLRSRDSIGNDLVVGPGGIVWLQSGRGALHEETPEIFGTELHGAQIYVNQRAANKMLPARTFSLQGGDAPRWSDVGGNIVRVIVGSYRDVASPLVPSEPFQILDLDVRTEVTVDFAPSSYSLIYARHDAVLAANGETRRLSAGEVVSVAEGASVSVSAKDRARLLVLSGPCLDEPKHAEGPFVVNDRRDVPDVVARYRRGDMGRLAPRG